MGYLWIILLLPALFARGHGSCSAPPRLEDGELSPEFGDQTSFPVNAKVNYTCRPGFTRKLGTQNTITCLSNSTWSLPETFCQRRSCGNPGDIANGNVEITDILFGSRVNYTCDIGYRMISRKNYRDCLADGTWSNEVPECDVQTCPPPNAITDGKFTPDKDEYEYLNAVSYECTDRTLTLIGERTLSCTAYGNWSTEPPVCREVKCSSPDVENSEKVFGFTGPYTLNSAVGFKCLQGFTMVGEAYVKCNDKEQWDPPLPTCSRSVTPKPATTKEKETGGSTVSQKPTAREKEENNGEGSNVGVIVGNTLIIAAMSVMALVINNGL